METESSVLCDTMMTKTLEEKVWDSKDDILKELESKLDEAAFREVRSVVGKHMDRLIMDVWQQDSNSEISSLVDSELSS